jgi:hypothetical protein
MGEQAAPFMHGTHAPSSQTRPVPHVVPLARLSDSTQTGAPVAQTIEPTRQGLSCIAQGDPAPQALQTPS